MRFRQARNHPVKPWRRARPRAAWNHRRSRLFEVQSPRQEFAMQSNERDPIQKPGTSPEHQKKQLKAGRIGVGLIAGVAILAFMLYAGIAIWAAVGSQ
jgi:hypothetical protein